MTFTIFLLISFSDCDNCERQYIDLCTKCGMLITLEGAIVPIGTENRAMKTVPEGILEIRPSKIHGFGVFAVKELNKGIRLGPYEGYITRIESTKGYSWKLKNGRLVSLILTIKNVLEILNGEERRNLCLNFISICQIFKF